MYDMYPEWGPARHRSPVDTLERDPHLQMLQESFDPRDDALDLADDN